MTTFTDQPLASVIIANYNGMAWTERCLSSLRDQTIARKTEIIVSDNDSKDGSDDWAAAWLAEQKMGQVVRNGANLGYGEANNIGAKVARGQYLFFLNMDTWLEPDCLEKLCAEAEANSADAAAPLVLDYNREEYQGSGAAGLDIFGLPNNINPASKTINIFAVGGCSLLVSREMFSKVGEFAPELFMYADETDISWRIWIAGGKIVVAPAARLHHRGATDANPKGETRMLESRTNETKRFLANRNSLLLLLKNSQHLFLLLLVPHLLLLTVETLVGFLLVRRWSFVQRCFLGVFADCWRMRSHIRTWRARIRGFRQRSDFWMLRFLHWRLNRWPDIKRIFRLGLPKVDAR